MRYCSRCLYPENHPLGIIINDEGVCSGCIVHEEKEILNWLDLEKKLQDIFEYYKSKKNYDCIIPVTGDRDSYFTVHLVKNIYGLNPLLVNYNTHFNTAVGVRNLSNLKTIFDCDLITQTINPVTIRKISKSTLRQFGSINWHCIAGQTVFPVQMAVKLKIPLIVWACHQGIDQVGMFSHLDKVEMTRKYRKNHDLMGYEAEDLINEFDNITVNDIKQFIYPFDEEIEAVGVRGIYLNNFIRWDNKAQHDKMINSFKFETAIQKHTFDYYNNIDSYIYNNLHNYIKFVKWGYTNIFDHATREIRLKRLSREDGINLVKNQLNHGFELDNKYAEWLGVEKNSLEFLINLHRNKDIWYQTDSWTWELKEDPIENLKISTIQDNELLLDNNLDKKFKLIKPRKSTDNENKFILIGKGTS